jgi:hypothetical protein
LEKFLPGLFQCCGWIRDPVPFLPLDPGSGIGFFPGSQAHIFERSMTIFWVKSIILCKLAQIFFFTCSKVKPFFDFVILVATRKGRKKFFSFLFSFVAIVGSGI